MFRKLRKYVNVSPVILFLVYLNCTSNSDVYIPDKIVTDFLTLELSFGAKDIKDEFLLARPVAITVNDDDDMIITDENRIKVFDKNGKEKVILGRFGQGPGEFTQISRPMLSPTGYLTVCDINYGYNVYSPELELITKTNFRIIPFYRELNRKNDWVRLSLVNVYSLNEHQRVVFINAREPKKEIIEYGVQSIYFEDVDNYTEIARYRDEDYISGSPISYQGEINWGMLPNNRLIYTHTGLDRVIENDKAKYILHIVSLPNLEKTQITHEYAPIELSDKALNRILGLKEGSPEARKLRSVLKKTKYQVTLQYLKVDRNFIFAFTNYRNEKNKYLADIFDADNGMYIHSAYFPFVPSAIKNGCAYKFHVNEEGFYEYQKYKIDPVVYGK